MQFPASNDRKIILFMKNRHLLNLIISSTEHLSQTLLSISMAFYLVGFKLASIRVYMVTAREGLTLQIHKLNLLQKSGAEFFESADWYTQISTFSQRIHLRAEIRNISKHTDGFGYTHGRVSRSRSVGICIGRDAAWMDRGLSGRECVTKAAKWRTKRKQTARRAWLPHGGRKGRPARVNKHSGGMGGQGRPCPPPTSFRIHCSDPDSQGCCVWVPLFGNSIFFAHIELLNHV